MEPAITDTQQAVIAELVRAGGATALGWFRRPHLVGATENKAGSGYDPVTEADRQIESDLRAGIAELFPDDTIVGEEGGTTGTGSRRWIIDPIDGTRAFITGQPLWGVLVGLYKGDDPLAGWAYLPVLDEMYSAVGGRSALEAGPRSVRPGTRPLVTSSTTELGEAVMATTHPLMFVPGGESDRFWELESLVRMSRFGGDCFNWALLADGTIDLVVENDLHPYDIAALIPLVEAAGGAVVTLGPGPAVDAGYVVGAATPELLAASLEVLDPNYRE